MSPKPVSLDGEPMDWVTFSLLLPQWMKAAAHAKAQARSQTLSDYLRDLIATDVGWRGL